MATAQLTGLVRYLRRVSLIDDRASFSDGDLLERFIRLRDPDAFEALMRRHGQPVLAICRQVLRNLHDAEDAFQATFLVLMHRAGSIANPEVVGSWLQGVAYYTARNARLGIERRRTHEDRIRFSSTLASSNAGAGPDIELVLEELARLPERLRAPMTLCDLQGKPRAQAARLLNCRPGTLSSRLARGRELLRTRLEQRGFQPVLCILAQSKFQAALRASLPPALTTRVMSAVTAHLTGPASIPLVFSGSAALLQATLRGLSLGYSKQVMIWMIGLLSLVGTGLVVQGNLLETPTGLPAEVSKPPAPLGQARPRLDSAGDPLPAGAIARIGSVRCRPGDEVTAVAISPDGSKLASGPIYSNVVQIWDRTNGQLLRECRGHAGTIMEIQFTPDGQRLVSSSLDKTVRIWDVATAREQAHLSTPWPGKFCISVDGKLLAISNTDQTVHLLDLATGKTVRKLKTGVEASSKPGFEPIALAFSANGQRLATSAQDCLRLWNVSTGRLEQTVDTLAWGQAQAAGFDGDNLCVLSSAYGPSCTLWLLPAQGKPRVLRVEPANLAQFTFSHDGQSVLFATTGSNVHEWSTRDGKELKRFPGSGATVRSLAYSPDGKFVCAGADDANLYLWDAATTRPLAPWAAPAPSIDGAAIAGDGSMVALVNSAGTVSVWDRATAMKRWLSGDPRAKTHLPVTVATDGHKVVASGQGNGVKVFAANSGAALQQILSTQPAQALILANGGKTVVATQSGRTVVWVDLESGKEIATYPEASKDQTLPEFSFLLAAFGKQVHNPCAAASPDGHVVVLGNQTQLTCIQKEDGRKPRLLFETQVNSVACLAISADGKSLASAGDDPFVLLWDVTTGKPTRQLETAGREITALAYSPDGKLLVAGTRLGKLLIWNLATGDLLANREGHRGGIRQLSFSADGSLLVTAGGTDKTALLWDARQLQTP